MIKVDFGADYTTYADEDFLSLFCEIVDEWNREDWKEVLDACRTYLDGGDVTAFERKWDLKFTRV